MSPTATPGAPDLPAHAGHVPGRSSTELASHLAYLARDPVGQFA